MRLVSLAVGALTFLSLGLLSLQYQVQRTGDQAALTNRSGEAYNVSEAVLGDVTTSLGVSVPGFFLAALVAFVAVLLAVVLR